MSKKELVSKGIIVGIEYLLTVEGEVIDKTEEIPLEYLHGHGNLISGLEKELNGLKIGESKKVTVAPAEGYGEFEEAQIIEVPRSEFPEEVPFVPGLEIEMTSVDEEILIGKIEDILKETILINFNHPLAGKTLVFDAKVVSLRQPTEEELEHGHVHHH